MCGLVGVVTSQDVGVCLYDTLTVLQHRGQDAAGIMTSDHGKLNLRKDNGLVKDVFRTRHMRRLTGQMGIGHVRYPTAGSSSPALAQPFYVNSPYGLSLAHNGANTYPDPAEIDRTFVSGAIVGTRVETMTVVPTVNGNLEIPEIAIPWWNIDTDQPQVTSIPAKILNVGAIAGAAPAEQAVSSSGNLEELLAMPPVVDQDMIDEQAEAEYIEIKANWLRYLISAAFLIVLFSIYRLVIRPNRQLVNHYLISVKNRITERYSPANNERVAFQQLLKALKRKEIQLIRTRLVVWCDHFIASRRIANVEDILQVQEAAELHEHIKDFQTDLFRKSLDSKGQRFDPARCILTIMTLRSAKIKQSKQQANEDRYSLPPLYRT